MVNAPMHSRSETYYTGLVTATAARAFGGAVDEERLRRYATDAVAALLRRGTRLTLYVPELALRAVREAVEADATRAADRCAAQRLPEPAA